MAEHRFPLLFNYIDDLIYTGLPSQIDACFTFLKKLLAELGLEISIDKLAPPFYCGKRDLQSLLLSLLYISKCVKHSSFFL